MDEQVASDLHRIRVLLERQKPVTVSRIASGVVYGAIGVGCLWMLLMAAIAVLMEVSQ